MTRKRLLAIAALVIAAVLLVWRWRSHDAADAESPDGASRSSVDAPAAAAARVERRDLGDTLAISGAFKAFQDVEVHAKVAGYIRAIYVDVGSRVKEGQVIAVLEVPELAAQLASADAAVGAAQEQIRRAQGDLQRAQSMHAAAHSAYTRLKQAADSRAGLVAQQEVDDAEAKDLGGEAQVASAAAELAAAKQQLEVAQGNRKQYSALSDYTRIVAPFAGVVTNRYADTGSLVAAGTSSSTQAIPVVRVAQTSVLRLVLPVPESVAGDIRVGEMIKVHVQALNRDFEGKVSRFADALNEQTRTMETEIDFENHNNALLPGMYAEAYLSPNRRRNVLTVPMEAVARNGDVTSVLVINRQNAVEERRVQLGQEGSTRIEVLSGVVEGERVIVGNLGEFRPGEKVTPKEPAGNESGANGTSGVR